MKNHTLAHPSCPGNRAKLFCFVLSLALSVLLVGCGDGAGSSAKSIVHEIDELAAHPADPNRTATGVALEDIIPRLAIEAGIQAVKDYPKIPRFHYQLGRAYEAQVGQIQNAIESYKKAHELGYPMASYNLAIIYATGSGLQMDLTRAAELFDEAIEKGISFAADSKASYIFSPLGYSSAGLFQALYEGKIEDLPTSESDLVNYLTAFTKSFAATDGCPPPMSFAALNKLQQKATMVQSANVLGTLAVQRRDNPTPNTGSINYEGAFNAGMNDANILSAKIISEAGVVRADAQLFYDRHGCDSFIARKVFKNIEAWALSLSEPTFKDFEDQLRRIMR